MRTTGASAVSGRHLIDGRWHPGGIRSSRPLDPQSGEPLDPPFPEAGPAEAEAALAAAARAAPAARELPGTRRADLLEAIAAAVLERKDDLIARARAETALPEPRLQGGDGEDHRTAPRLRRAGPRGLLGGGDDRPRRPGAEAAPPAGRAAHAPSPRTGGGLRRRELPLRLRPLRGRCGLRARRREPGGGEGAPRPPRRGRAVRRGGARGPRDARPPPRPPRAPPGHHPDAGGGPRDASCPRRPWGSPAPGRSAAGSTTWPPRARGPSPSSPRWGA